MVWSCFGINLVCKVHVSSAMRKIFDFLQHFLLEIEAPSTSAVSRREFEVSDHIRLMPHPCHLVSKGSLLNQERGWNKAFCRDGCDKRIWLTFHHKLQKPNVRQRCWQFRQSVWGLVQLFSVHNFRDAGLYLLVMEFCPGGTLTQRIQRTLWTADGWGVTIPSRKEMKKLGQKHFVFCIMNAPTMLWFRDFGFKCKIFSFGVMKWSMSFRLSMSSAICVSDS